MVDTGAVFFRIATIVARLRPRHGDGKIELRTAGFASTLPAAMGAIL
ncbi:hypothetical protein [Metallibacterium sp.]|nr:hypothetical protein [Metallibacterium sp.]